MTTSFYTHKTQDRRDGPVRRIKLTFERARPGSGFPFRISIVGGT